jgi:hypothetical protein
MRRQQRVVSVRRASSTNKESSGEEETMEDEVMRLRGEVEALRKEVQRLLRLNADQTNNDVATNKPQPTAVPLPPPKEIPSTTTTSTAATSTAAKEARSFDFKQKAGEIAVNRQAASAP